MFYIVIGDVARVNGQLAVSRAFGDKNLKSHLRSDPDVQSADIGPDTDLLIIASDGLWKVISFSLSKRFMHLEQSLLPFFFFLFSYIVHLPSFVIFQVMSNQEAVDIARKTKDPQRAAKLLVAESLNRDSKDDISCVVVRFKVWNKRWTEEYNSGYWDLLILCFSLHGISVTWATVWIIL